ncbi:alpha/beta fold hydrolase [Sphingomonas sp. ASY06-1R]|uniref:alpha/beta fold hydrolase n=1 Tax=Sphingomonas sp. ASY06-1R TaxID=3445771 RepID=UPI003FA2EF3C
MTLQDAPNRYVEAAGVRFGYRKIGTEDGIPLVLLQHFTGTIDSWDPQLVNALARDRPVILFNNRGVGTSSGTTPDSVAAMADDADLFLSALGIDQADLLGFSLGGFVAQVLAARSPSRVRKLILVGTAPQGGEEHLLEVVADAAQRRGSEDIRLPLFFTPSAASQAAGRAFLARQAVRAERDPDRGEAVSNPQAKALIDWCAMADDDDALLKSIAQPTLVMSGAADTMLPAANAYRMFRAMPDAQLILYPDAGHGALFQYAALFSAHCALFLNGVPKAD